MNVLIACEESQRVCIEFRKRGHNAFSCDILDPSGGHPEWHIKANVLPLLDGMCKFQTMDGKTHELPGHWDLIIAHPPCTYLTVSGNRWFSEKYGQKAEERKQKRLEAGEFFLFFTECMCEHVAIENPIGWMNSHFRKPDQIIQPYQFGDPVSKKTCLWLYGLPKLKPTKIVDPEIIHSKGKSGGYSGPSWTVKDEQGKILPYTDPRVAKERAKTYPGIATAMAEQWNNLNLLQ